MQCALSGETPQTPAVSSKSGNVYERRLIEAYISENGKDPVTGEEMTVDDLIDIKTDRTVRPRPPTFTSIPSLLSAFQNEWDALVLDSYTVRQQLTQTRQELSTALYQHDAAIRVIARLVKERDEARNALSQVTTGQASSGDAMQVDSTGLSEKLSAVVDTTQENLSKTRKKRPVPADWATGEDVTAYKPTVTSEPLFHGAQFLVVNDEGLAIVGGSNGDAGIYSTSDNRLIHTMQMTGSATDALFSFKVSGQVFVASSSGVVKAFKEGKEVHSFASHAGSATSLALHPSGDILASVGSDKSFVFYDIVSNSVATQVHTESALSTAAFHPDGHLFATGGADGKIKLYHTKTAEFAASFDCGSPVQDISFSENGIWFAVATKGSNSVIVFDIRKQGKAAEIKVIDTGSEINSVRWDYTGQFLATADASGVTIQQYTKSSKSWSEPLRSAIPAIAVAWGPSANSLLSINDNGVITVLSA